MTGSIRVVQPGPLSTIQDLGRGGFQKFGVSVGGAMDVDAVMLGNRLVGNSVDAAVIEVTFGGASFEFDTDSLVAVTGGDLGLALDGLAAPNWTAFVVPAGGLVAFSTPTSGLRAYLCVAGGVATEPQLGSRSTHLGAKLGGLRGEALAAEDVLPIGDATRSVVAGLHVPPSMRPEYQPRPLEVRVIPGPQADVFSAQGLKTFYESEYSVTDRSDRQGIRLDGPVIQTTSGRYDIVSDAVAAGAVQVPGDGKPIVLMADRQTTGGYTKIGVVASVDLPLLAQALPGTPVRFRQVEVEEAQELLRTRQGELEGGQFVVPIDLPDRVFSIEGDAHVARVAGLAAGGPPWMASVEVDGVGMRAHVEEIEVNETE